MEGVEVPSFFLCPISLQIMRDPVTVPTGITYDRDPIERWLFTCNRTTCPLTNQPLATSPDSTPDLLLTPNHTLRRLIQAWCAANASQGVERFPTPRPPVTSSQIARLIHDPSDSTLPHLLSKLKTIVSESDRNRRVVESSGAAVDFLASIVEKHEDDGILHEALHILHSLQMSEQTLVKLLETRGAFVDALISVLQASNYQCRAYSVLLLKSLVSAVPPVRLMSQSDAFFVEIVRVLRDRISYQATKAALQVLSSISPWGGNRVRAVEAGAVAVLIELLLGESERVATEMILMVLARLSECAEGRAEIVGHAAGIAVVSKKLVRVSVAASERAVRIMHGIASFSPTAAVLREMVEMGAVSKMCLLIQADCGLKTKERVKEILSMHSRVWRSSPCVSPLLHCSFPPS